MTTERPFRILRAWWMQLAHALGWINARIVLSAIFFLVFMPVGLIARLVGWDPLRRRWPSGQSGWVPYPERHQDPTHYERMY